MKATDAEREEVRTFFAGRHSQEEWDAGLWFYSRPLWQQRVLKVIGLLFVIRYL
jgi:hypothetical protein